MQRTIYFDYLRVIACFAVVVLHISTTREFYDCTEPTFEWNVMNIYDSATRFCVPIFLMISGALFLNPDKKLSLRKLYTHNILRVITAFCFWSFIYACYEYSSSEGPSFLTLFLCGHFHMWFLWLIVGLYMMTPILRLITENRRMIEYFLFFSFVFSFVVPFIFELTKIFVPTLTSLVEIGEMYCGNLRLHMLSGFTFYFILGYYLHTTHITRKIENAFILLGILACTGISGMSYFLFRSTSVLNESFYDYGTFFVMLETIAIFLFVRRLVNEENKLIYSLSKYSFGIYLVHMFVYYILGLTPTMINPLIGIPLLSLLVFVVSYVIVLLLSRIPILNRWVI